MSMPTVRGKPTPVSADLMRPPRRWTNMLLIGVVATVVAAIAWANWAALEEVTSGTGRVIPASKIKFVQNLEGGIVSEIMTEDGARVKKGQVLLRIDPTGFGSRLNESLERRAGLRASIARLRAETQGTALVFPDEVVAQHPDLTIRETALFNTRRSELRSALNALSEQVTQRSQEISEIRNQVAVIKRSLAFAREELTLMRPAVDEGIIPMVELLRLQARVNELAGKHTAAQLALPRLKSALGEAKQRHEEREQNFRTTAQSDMNRFEVELAALLPLIGAQRDRVARTEVRSPVDGIVKEVKVTTIGQVVQPGMDLIEILPIDDSLLIEAKVRPADIAFLRPGQPVIVKITAFDYTIYGNLTGELERISADTIEDKEGNSFYLIRVRTKKSYLGKKEEGHIILPGMVAQVDIIIGKKTVLQYITKPLARIRDQALREK